MRDGVAGNTRIDDLQRNAERGREDIGGRAPGKKIQQHLARHRLRISGDTGSCHAVIAGEQRQTAGRGIGPRGSL